MSRAGSHNRLVLCYHAVSATWTRDLSVTPERLEAQLGLLADRGFQARTFAAAVNDANPAERAVAITFDDAYRSVLEVAKPILDRYEMPATVFVPTSFVGSKRPMSWPGIDAWTSPLDRSELVPMSWAELESLSDGGWEIAAHSRTHPRLTALDDERLEEELVGSKADIEDRLGVRCRTIAYPYGDFDARVTAAATASGFEAGGTLDAGLPDPSHPLACPRVGVYHVDDVRRFRLKISTVVRRGLASAAGQRLASLVR